MAYHNMVSLIAWFLYEHIWFDFCCPIELISDQGGHFLHTVINGLIHHYAVVSKKSTPCYPHANGLAESTNKTLKNILLKMVNENQTNWDTKLCTALWAYWTSVKTSVQATPFRLAYGLEVVMSVAFKILS